MKILYVCPMAHSSYHPRSRTIRETAVFLKAGLEVSLCTFKGLEGEEISPEIVHKTVVSSWFGLLFRICTPLEKAGRPGYMLAGFLEKFATLCLAFQLRGNLKYDVLYLRDGDSLIAEQLIPGLFTRNLRWAVSIIASNTAHPPNKWLYRVINAPLWKPLYRRAMGKNRYLFFCENQHVKDLLEKDHLQGILAGRVKMLQCPIIQPEEQLPRRQAREKLGLPENRTVLLHFGTLHAGKDIETVLAAVSGLDGVLLVHVGYVEPWYDLRGIIERYNLGDQIRTKEQYVSEEEKNDYFAAADAIILSYKKTFKQNASMLWEAAASGLPVIASDGGEMAQLVGSYQTGLVFAAEEAGSLRETIKIFMDLSREERERMSLNFGPFCDKYSMKAWVAGCVDMFTELQH
jgi:glycosyltransferase involved in cell wall biosynthesis